MSVLASHIGSEDECIKIYDPEKKELLRVFNTYGDANKYTGISPKILRNAALSKTRRFSPFLNKEIAIRIATKGEEEILLIKKYCKHPKS